jgi:hypothetical protein
MKRSGIAEAITRTHASRSPHTSSKQEKVEIRAVAAKMTKQERLRAPFLSKPGSGLRSYGQAIAEEHFPV